ncbi:MAG: ATP-binding protein [Lacipirellulaceae bacterium]
MNAANCAISVYEKGLEEGSSITDLLRVATKSLGACGCVLWARQPASTAHGPSHLFVLTAWFPFDTPFAMYDLSVSDSASGQALVTNEVVIEVDVRQSGGETPALRFFDKHGIRSMLAAPITLSEGVEGTLNFYKSEREALFDESLDPRKAMATATALSKVYQALRSRESSSLLSKIEAIIQQHDYHPSDPDKSAVSKNLLHSCATAIANSFRSLEVSVFLENPLQSSGTYNLHATTWQDWCEKTQTYSADSRSGLTGWVLSNRESIRLFDLSNFERDKERIRQQYENLEWHRSMQFLNAVRKKLNLQKSENLPPVSFMASPIVAGNRLLGAIRVCAAKSGPYYFSEADSELLLTAAGLIGHYWHERLSRRIIERDSVLFQGIVDHVGELNKVVKKNVAKAVVSHSRYSLFNLALEKLNPPLQNASGYAVRSLKTPVPVKRRESETTSAIANNDATLVLMKGDAFAQSIVPSKAASSKSVDCRIYNATKLASPNCRPLSLDRDSRINIYKEIGEEIEGMSSPVLAGDTLQAVFDVFIADDTQSHQHASTISELIGEQLGLYLELDEQIDRFRTAQSALRKSLSESRKLERQRRRALEDLAHQLKNPLEQAKRKSEFIVDTSSSPSTSSLEMRGLCRRAWRVANGMRFLAELQDRKSITTTKQSPDPDVVYRLICTLLEDAELLSESYMNISYRVDPGGFNYEVFGGVEMDMALLEQALINVIDNAYKYSFQDTTIKVRASRTRSSRLALSISSTGLSLSGQEIALCKQREWRSEDAENVTSEGSGIGLWVVDEIMVAHGGHLEIVPTDSSHRTDVKLIF